jgi:hypothetical protein
MQLYACLVIFFRNFPKEALLPSTLHCSTCPNSAFLKLVIYCRHIDYWERWMNNTLRTGTKYFFGVATKIMATSD